jgi:hypothetical protein
MTTSGGFGMSPIHSRLALVSAVLVPLHLITFSARAAEPLHFWSQRFGDTGTDEGLRVATDAARNIFVVGDFNGTVDFGGGGLTSAGGADIFLAKYDANGFHLWSKRFGSTGADAAHGVAVDADGNVFVTGYFSGTVDFGGGGLTSAGGWDIFLAKYSSSGTHQWSKRFGSSGSDLAKRVAVDVPGDVFLTGYVGGTVDFGGGEIPFGGGFDIFLAKIDSSGAHEWSQVFGGGGIDEGEGLAVDPTGSALIIGYFQSAVDFGGGVLTGAGFNDICVAKFDSDGVHVWSQAFGGASNDIGVGVAADASGNVLVTGLFSGTVDFGGGDLVGIGQDVFVAKYDPGGAHAWSRHLGQNSPDIGFDVVADASGNAFLTGVVGGIFVAKYSPSGDQEWYQEFLTGWGFGVALDVHENLLVTGSFSGALDFGGGQLAAAGGTDVFLLKYGTGTAEPSIVTVIDVGNDQGRQVKISFSRSGYDSPGAPLPVAQYEAFRRDDPLPAGSGLPPSGGSSSAGSRATDWVFVGSVPAHGESDYKILVPTAADSTVTHGQYYSTFFVRAATVDPFAFFDSAADSGYSLDNLAPSAPVNLTYDGGTLSWLESPETDFDYFTVYGSASDSLDGSAVVIDYTVGTSVDVSASAFPHYFVTATDFSGNEGPPAGVSTSSNVDDAARSSALSILAYPNPCNPGTTVRYGVPSRGRTAVTIYDVHGSLVRKLVDEERAVGSHAVRWEGVDMRGARARSGVYFARVEVGGQTRSAKIVLLR